MNEQLEDLLFLESMAEIQKHFKPFILKSIRKPKKERERKRKHKKERERKKKHKKEKEGGGMSSGASSSGSNPASPSTDLMF